MLKHLFIGYISILTLLPHITLADTKTKYDCPWNVQEQEQGFLIQYAGFKNINGLNFYAFLQAPEEPITYDSIQTSVQSNNELTLVAESLIKPSQENLDIYLVASNIEIEGLQKNKLTIAHAAYQKTNISLEPITNTKVPGDGTLILRPVKQDDDEKTKDEVKVASNLNYLKVCRMVRSAIGK